MATAMAFSAFVQFELAFQSWYDPYVYALPWDVISTGISILVGPGADRLLLSDLSTANPLEVVANLGIRIIPGVIVAVGYLNLFRVSIEVIEDRAMNFVSNRSAAVHGYLSLGVYTCCVVLAALFWSLYLGELV